MRKIIAEIVLTIDLFIIYCDYHEIWQIRQMVIYEKLPIPLG